MGAAGGASGGGGGGRRTQIDLWKRRPPPGRPLPSPVLSGLRVRSPRRGAQAAAAGTEEAGTELRTGERAAGGRRWVRAACREPLRTLPGRWHRQGAAAGTEPHLLVHLTSGHFKLIQP